MTRNAAAVIGRTKDLGTLEPGKLGDLVILDGDPLADSSDRLCTKNTSWALIERPYSCAPQAVGAVYDRPGFVVQSPLHDIASHTQSVLSHLHSGSPILSSSLPDRSNQTNWQFFRRSGAIRDRARL